jgi:methyltransferase (TIGR00027 family)
MEPLTASRTALVTSLMRALHTRADPHPIISDPWGDRLVPEAVLERVRATARSALSSGAVAGSETASNLIVDRWLRASVAYAGVITRSRYAEDALHAAVARGVRQYVLIGAGFDSYALRTPPEARDVEIFEVDHPATQGLKRQRIVECGVSLRDPVHFLAADLSKERLGDVLSGSCFNSAAPAFFSWLGVTMYLTREANVASLRAIARASAPGSELVFTYLDEAAFRDESDSAPPSVAALRRSVESIGEPFLSGFEPEALARDLRGVGFELEEDLDDFQTAQRYDPRGLNGLQPAGQSRIARARVMDAGEQRAGS